MDLEGSGSPPTDRPAPTDHTFGLGVCPTGSVSMPYDDDRRIRIQAAVRFAKPRITLEV